MRLSCVDVHVRCQHARAFLWVHDHDSGHVALLYSLPQTCRLRCRFAGGRLQFVYLAYSKTRQCSGCTIKAHIALLICLLTRSIALRRCLYLSHARYGLYGVLCSLNAIIYTKRIIRLSLLQVFRAYLDFLWLACLRTVCDCGRFWTL